MTEPSAERRPWTGWHMLVVIVSFFAVVIAVNVTMAYFAISSWSGLVVKSSYVASQDFNGDMRVAKEQNARGWRTGIDYDGGRLSFELEDAAGRPLTGAAVVVTFGRPVHEGEDRVLTLSETALGRYQVAAELAPGVWNARALVAGLSAGDYRRDFRLIVPSGSAQ